MKHMILYIIFVLALALAGCTQCTAVDQHNPTKKISTDEATKDNADCITESYFVENTESNLITIQLPSDSAFSVENMEFIKTELQNVVTNFCGKTFELIPSATDIADKKRHYTECCLILTSQIQYKSENWISITFSGFYNERTATHPLYPFFVLNFDPKNNTMITFFDRYTADITLYEMFSKEGSKLILERNAGIWPDGWDTFSEEVCSEEKFFQGLGNGALTFYRTSQNICFVPEMPVAFGEPLVITIPISGIEGDGLREP